MKCTHCDHLIHRNEWKPFDALCARCREEEYREQEESKWCTIHFVHIETGESSPSPVSS